MYMKIEQKTIKYQKVLNKINKSKEKDRKLQELINTIFFIALAGSLFAHAPDLEKIGMSTLGIKGSGMLTYFVSLLCSTIFTLRVLSGIRKRKGLNRTEEAKNKKICQ